MWFNIGIGLGCLVILAIAAIWFILWDVKQDEISQRKTKLGNES